jgi:hypothetical protein
MITYNQYVLRLIFLNIIFCCIYWIFIRRIRVVKYKRGDCYGQRCVSVGCNGMNCVAGKCIGENCKAGNCVGKNCRAGDCFGFNCKPGTCLDTDCPKGTCPQQNKKCIDGVKYNINRPFYYKLTKNFSDDTLLNPKLCADLRIGDVREGRLKDMKIHTVNTRENGTFLYQDIFMGSNMNKIKDNETINYTIPMYDYDNNCRMCVKNRCEKEL